MTLNVEMDLIRWTPEGCRMKISGKELFSGANDKTTISTGVQGGGRKADAILREAPGPDLP